MKNAARTLVTTRRILSDAAVSDEQTETDGGIEGQEQISFFCVGQRQRVVIVVWLLQMREGREIPRKASSYPLFLLYG